MDRSGLMFSSAMLRRILACLALITGLAAVGTPADARMTVVQAQSIVDGAQTQQGSTSAPCEEAKQKAALRGKVATQSACKPRRPVVIFIPTIQFGPDRALE